MWRRQWQQCGNEAAIILAYVANENQCVMAALNGSLWQQPAVTNISMAAMARN